MKRAAIVTGLLALTLSSSAHCRWESWQEEVMLHDGQTLSVSRSVDLGYGGYQEQRLSFRLPDSFFTRIQWHDAFSPEVRGANFNPMLLDMVNGIFYLVATPAGCLSYNKWGRPNPPYVVFKYEGKEWQRIALNELPDVLTMPNLVLSSPDKVGAKAQDRTVSARDIKALYAGYSQPEYKTILREPLQRDICPRDFPGPQAPGGPFRVTAPAQ